MLKQVPKDLPRTDNSVPNLKYEHASPRAESMIESLRAFGYDLPTALVTSSPKSDPLWV